MAKLIVGVNDLATVHPELLEEWDYEKNNELGIYPDKVTCGSNRKAWWICKFGHKWQTKICCRSNGSGCPKCFHANQTSFAEQAIYYFLDMVFPNEVENRYKLKDKNGCFEVDIYLPKLKIALEHDGRYWHKNRREKDLKKEFRVKSMGIRFIRVVESDKNKVINNYIFYNICNLEKNLSWAIQELFNLLNIGYLFIDVQSFYGEILEFYHRKEIENSLSVVNPEIAKEWHPTKNGNLLPVYFSSQSNYVVWWKCSKGHEWRASISHRVNGTGCPYCLNQKVLKGYNDMATTNPELAKQWHPIKNGNLSPFNVTMNSNKKVWWICDKGHEWMASIASRNKGGYGCPYCSGRCVIKGKNDLESQYPELAKEWHPTKNGNLLPSQVSCSSDKKIWWQCSKGHEWHTSVNCRTHKNSGCPICSNRKILVGYNDLESLYPDIAKEWHPTKNENLLPSQISCGSEIKPWWKCSVCGHEWQAIVYNRIRGHGCPKCASIKAGKIRSLPRKGESLLDKCPKLADEWNYDKNGDLTPDKVTVHSNKRVWWRCKKGHEWESLISNRSKGRGCPVCAKAKRRKKKG